MAHTAKHLVLTLATAALFTAPFADAAKFGGGKSSGMQRSTPSKSQSYNATPAQQAPAAPMYGKTAPNSAPQQRSGPGIGTAVAAGVAGAAAGYMLGSAMSDNPAPAAAANGAAAPQAAGAPMPAQQAQALTGAAPAAPASSGMPWGTLLLLAALLGGGLWWMMRRKATPALGRGGKSSGQSARDSLLNNNNSLRNGPSNSNPPAPGTGGGLFDQFSPAQPAAPLANGRLPDGTEVPHFLRQAKATFMHLQSMNNPANVGEVAKYLTPEMFAAVKAEVTHNSEVADFPTLNCDLLEAVEENGRYIASVHFHGMVSESVNAPITPFSEVWHYVKGHDTDNKWLVAGIQQQ